MSQNSTSPINGSTPAPNTWEFAFLAATGAAPVPSDAVAGSPPLSEGESDTARAATVGEPTVQERTAEEPTDVAANFWPLPKPAPSSPGIESGLGLRKFRDRLSTPPVIRAWRRPPGSELRIRAEVTRARLHADLPATTMWAYEGSLPGPTIEVASGSEARIAWENALFDVKNGGDGAPAHLPYDVVRVPPLVGAPGFNGDIATAQKPGGRSTVMAAGEDSFPSLPNTPELTGATVVHLHGALTNGHNDGWAHNVAGVGQTTRTTYPNRQEATTLWYHDHAMAVTRFNVYAGLAGFYLIRDRQEAGLRLPSGDYEIPLMLSDRNLESTPAAAGSPARFTGRMLYKQAGFTLGPAATPGEVPVSGPFNMVNGKIWPTRPVEARWYRFRILNASNSRVYRLAVHDTTDEKLTPDVSVASTDPAFIARRVANALTVIGTDGGLLSAPYTPSDGVIELGPAERVDVLINFAALRARTLELRNELATAANAQPGQAEASVMQFTVSKREVRERWQPPAVLNGGYRRYHHRDDGKLEIGDTVIESHAHAWVGVVPPGTHGGVHPEMWELAELGPEDPVPTTDAIQIRKPDGTVGTLCPVAKLFDDATTIFINRGEWAVWHLIHMGGPDHPIHIHMTEFQMINRRQWPIGPGNSIPQFDPATGTTREPLPTPGPGRPITAIDAGMKDTWVLKAGEWVSVLGHFDGAAGSFMYHCHIMDHEDHTMMRPFVVLPPDLMAFHRGHGGGHH